MTIPTSLRFKNLTGQQFGRLTAVEYLGSVRRASLWRCECDCGGEARVTTGHLTCGHTQSCGCYMKDRTSESTKTHGLSKDLLYQVWLGMMKRCYDKNHKGYPWYGQRGIKVCEGMKLLKKFKSIMGDRPSKFYSLDRIENNLHYSCGECRQCKKSGWEMNCRWATKTEQQNNMRSNVKITFDNKTLSVSQWSREIGIPRSVICGRIRLGWPIELTLTLPSDRRRKHRS